MGRAIGVVLVVALLCAPTGARAELDLTGDAAHNIEVIEKAIGTAVPSADDPMDYIDPQGNHFSFSDGHGGRESKEASINRREQSENEVVESANREFRRARKEQKERDLKAGDAGYLTDDVMSKTEAEVVKIEQETAKRQAERRERMGILRPSTLISHEKEGD